MRLHGQAVKTSPFHGGNTGSIPVGVIKPAYNHIWRRSQVVRRGSATPLSPVQIRSSPLSENLRNLVKSRVLRFFLCVKSACACLRHYFGHLRGGLPQDLSHL